MNVTPEQEAALHAKLDELMNSGEQPFIHVHGAGRLAVPAEIRSEERRVGKECRSRGSPYH